MDAIVVISPKLNILELENLGNELGQAIEIVDSGASNVKILHGYDPHMLSQTEVLVLLITSGSTANMGEKIIEYKSKVLEIFRNYNIELTKNSLQVKLSPPIDIEQYIKSIEKTNSKNEPNLKANKSDEFDYEEKSKQYIPVEPLYSFDRVILPEDIVEKIEEAIGILECEHKVFNEWGLYEIQPHPSTSLSFFGPPGTGKTMAAEAVASKLGKKILKVSYADVESKFHGEGPKMVKAIFLAAEREDAVLFFDEADSLLSKRLTSVSQGSEQAINSMRSQLLICLEEFRGIVIFATNLVINYDQAFLTRLISVEFYIPDVAAREKIWEVHIRPKSDGTKHKLNIPLAENVDIKALAEGYELVGREIRNAVVSACVSAALDKKEIVGQEDFVKACEKIVAEKKSLAEAKDHTKNAAENDVLKKAILNKIKQKAEDENNVSKSTE